MCGDEVIQDVAVLLLERRHHCHHTLNKMRACRALCAKAAFAPLHTRTDRPFSRIIGGLNAFDLHEGPSRQDKAQERGMARRRLKPLIGTLWATNPTR
jgi:hypothetical protein